MQNRNIGAVRDYFEALGARDRIRVGSLLDEQVREVVPLSPTGEPEPWAEFQGREAVLAYTDTIFHNFSEIGLRDEVFTISDDGLVVFLEARGALVFAATVERYENRYVFKFTFSQEGRITRIDEYANPVPIARLLGVKIG